MTRALAHIGVHILHMTLYRGEVLVLILKKVQLYTTLEFSFLFYFDFTSACNFVFVFHV